MQANSVQPTTRNFEHEQVGSSVTQYIWIGGDAYTAVAVAKKTGTGSWVVYNIFRDHLGTITHLKTGSTIDEYSFDACDVKLRFCKPCETKPLAEHIPKSVAVREGRRRDKDNWGYTLSGEPALFADRGFTGTRSVSSGFGELCEAKTDERTNPAECSESGKFLSDFNLYNMPARLSHFHLNYFSDGQAGGNGRLYDHVLGRFLSPDPYIADPSFTQSYNRYSYVLNNPLKYNDPTGELPLWALWGIASAGNWLFGGLDNWLNKGMSFKQSFSTANNPITFSANYHPGSNSWGNSQVNAHRLVGSMANAERGIHSYVAGLSGMGRNGDGSIFTSTPLPQFLGESPLAYGVAVVRNVDAVSGPAIDVGPYEGRYLLFFIAYDRLSVYYYANKINKAFAELQKEQPHIFYNLFNSIELGENNIPAIETINVFIKANISKIFACLKNFNKTIGIQQNGEKYELLDFKLLNPTILTIFYFKFSLCLDSICKFYNIFVLLAF